MSRQPIERDKSRLAFGTDDSQTPILHIDMDAFYASVELIERPELRGQPVVIGGSSGRGVVLSATYEAREFGIHAAMPISTAKRLAPHAVFISPSHKKYAEVSSTVMGIFHDITYEVEPLSLDEAFLNVAGAIRRLGSPLRIAELIRERVAAEAQITCSVGIAENKFLAKLASTAIKPDGLLLVPPDHVIAFLHPLPVSALWGVGPKTAEQLNRLGLKRVEDIANTPVETLRRTLGVSLGNHLAELAWGRDERIVNRAEVEKSIGQETTFTHDSDDSEFHLARLLELSEQVARRARANSMVGTTVVLKLRFSDFQTITRSKKLSSPLDTSHEIFEVIKSLYLELRLARARVRLLGVRLEGLLPASEYWEQLSFDSPELGWREAEQTIDKATKKFGAGTIRPARLFRADDNSD
ncbi:MAG: polymerase [Actinomycetota bacterium]